MVATLIGTRKSLSYLVHLGHSGSLIEEGPLHSSPSFITGFSKDVLSFSHSGRDHFEWVKDSSQATDDRLLSHLVEGFCRQLQHSAYVIAIGSCLGLACFHSQDI